MYVNAFFSVFLEMAEWKYDQLDGEEENGEDAESTSSVSFSLM